MPAPTRPAHAAVTPGQRFEQLAGHRRRDVLDDLDAGFGVGGKAQPQPGAVHDILLGQRQRRFQRRAIDPAQRPSAPRAGGQRGWPSSSSRLLTKSTNADSCTDTGAPASSTTPILVTPAITATNTRSGNAGAVDVVARPPAAVRWSPPNAPAVGNPPASSAASSRNANWVGD